MAANRQTDIHTYIHTHMRNEVTLVWGPLRLAPTTKLEGLRTTYRMGLLHGMYLRPLRVVRTNWGGAYGRLLLGVVSWQKWLINTQPTAT